MRATVGAEHAVGVRFRERGHPHLERVRAAVDVVAEEEIRDVPGGDNQRAWAVVRWSRWGHWGDRARGWGDGLGLRDALDVDARAAKGTKVA